MIPKQTVRSVTVSCVFACFVTIARAQEPAAAPALPPAADAPAVVPTDAVPAPTDPAAAAPADPAAAPVEPAPAPAETVSAPPESVVAPSPASAPPLPATAAAGDALELDARIAALDAYLKDQQPRSRAYYGAFISLLGLFTAGQALRAVDSDDAGTRASYVMGSAFSAVALTLVLVSPTPGRYAHRKFTALPEDSLEEKRRKARMGEEWLEGEAKAVHRTKSLFTHLLGLAFGVGGFLGLYFGYEDNLENALRTGIGTVLVTELRILTRPYRAVRYLDAYRRSPTSTPGAAMFALAPMVHPGAQGMTLGGRF